LQPPPVRLRRADEEGDQRAPGGRRDRADDPRSLPRPLRREGALVPHVSRLQLARLDHTLRRRPRRRPRAGVDHPALGRAGHPAGPRRTTAGRRRWRTPRAARPRARRVRRRMTYTPTLFVCGLVLILIASLFVAAPLFRPARAGAAGDDASERA